MPLTKATTSPAKDATVPPNAAQPQATTTEKAAPQTKSVTDPKASQAPYPTTNPAL
ncbi:hypothetical protein GCM10022254_02640 [Actinomadura meridiana]|uniref:Uncharacterized protein n=1 Tax=Actinomadura meridiana TaxID=559626 RepID=A0ABP8BS01_9ACTN